MRNEKRPTRKIIVELKSKVILNHEKLFSVSPITLVPRTGATHGRQHRINETFSQLFSGS